MKLSMTSLLGFRLYTVTLILFLFGACKEAKPQSYKERQATKKAIERDNLDQFFLGAMKMCADTDYAQHFGNHRELSSFSREGNCCTSLVPAPYIDPYEFYIYLFEEQKPIFQNYANPFELKKIRESIKGKKADARKKALAIDTDNLIYKMQCFFVKYDMNREELILQVSSGFSFSTGNAFSMQVNEIKAINLPSEIRLSLSSAKAEKLFDYYARNSPAKKLIPYSLINMRITYGLKFPDRNIKGARFDAVVNRLEFFPMDNWTYKIGEITF